MQQMSWLMSPNVNCFVPGTLFQVSIHLLLNIPASSHRIVSADSDDSDDEMHRVGSNKRKRSITVDKDDDFAPHQSQGQKKSRGKGQTQGMATTSKGPKGIVQRPRTDWQRRGPTTWVKIVPPWWAEQKTVHFASTSFFLSVMPATNLTFH